MRDLMFQRRAPRAFSPLYRWAAGPSGRRWAEFLSDDQPQETGMNKQAASRPPLTTRHQPSETSGTVFTSDPTSVGQARRFVAAQLVGRASDTVSTAVLMVSELATNCIMHARS